ncbi:MAG: hypothetical protein LBR19_06770 [Bifidobacteriaceae bacterium]|jgi:hypothetical protein|nr:hypothetical protein [Bifidobacteriaceae bacterium]
MAEDVVAVVQQGTQVPFGSVLVGAMRVGLLDGALAVRLAVRSRTGDDIQVVPVGGTVELPGEGVLRVDQIDPPADGERSRIHVTWLQEAVGE